ncbi:MAG: RteC domain-containing protein [Mucilaginibacter sp.]
MILRYSEKLYDDLQSALAAIRLRNDRRFMQLEQSLKTALQSFIKLRDFYRTNPLTDRSEQLRFFKEVKPKFKCLVLFHQQALGMESRKPVGDKQVITDYYLAELKILTHYFEAHMDFYRYIRLDLAHLDEKYFLPGEFDPRLLPEGSLLDGDPSFTTSHDHVLAQIMANELMLVYLEKSILELNHKEEMDLSSFIEEEVVTWTQTNTALTELIYGLKETKALNHGNLSVARMTAYFEKVFHAELGNISDTWNYICGRAGKTIYLDEMKKAVLERMAAKFK